MTSDSPSPTLVQTHLRIGIDCGGQVAVDVTGRWVGTGTSEVYAGCSANLDVQLVQTGNTINGNGTMNAPCLGGTYAGTITGTVNGSKITVGMAGDATSQISYRGNIAADQARANGTYDWPDEDDDGSWALRRQ